MTLLLRVLWNLPATVLQLAATRFSGVTLRHDCDGRWRLQKRNGKPFERCVKCGAERRARLK
jgi:hypothetical protein